MSKPAASVPERRNMPPQRTPPPPHTWSQADTDAMVAKVRRVDAFWKAHNARQRRIRIAKRIAWAVVAIVMAGLAIALWSTP